MRSFERDWGMGYAAYKGCLDRFNEVVRRVARERGLLLVDLEARVPKEGRLHVRHRASEHRGLRSSSPASSRRSWRRATTCGGVLERAADADASGRHGRDPHAQPTRLLELTLASLARQSLTGWEAVVVDDASEDATWSWLSELQDPRVRRIRLLEKSERAAARNAGLAGAAGAFVMFLDDDDQLPAARARDPRGGAAPASRRHRLDRRLRDVRGSGLGGGGAPRAPPRLRPILHDVLFGWMAVSGQCLFRADVLRAVGGWEGAWIPIEDHVLLLRAASRGPVALLPGIVLMYRVHPGSGGRTTSNR